MKIKGIKNKNDILILNGILREYRDDENGLFGLAVFPLIKQELISGSFFIEQENPIFISEILRDYINNYDEYEIFLYHNKEEIVPIEEMKYRGYKQFSKGHIRVKDTLYSHPVIEFKNEEKCYSISDELNKLKNSYIHLEFHKQ